MKKILAILALAAFLPAMAFAAGSGGSAPPYHLVWTKIGHDGMGTEEWSSTATADSLDDWTLNIAAATAWGVPETTTVISTHDMVCPYGAAAFASLFIEKATADTVRVTPQVSPDKSNWMSLGTVDLGAAVQILCLPIEASTAITTPMWPYMRFIVEHYDAGAKATPICSVTLWFIRYEKD